MNLGFLRAVTPTPETAEWYNVVAKFKQYANEFTANYSKLQSININPAEFPELADEQFNLLKSGAKVKSTIQEVTGAINRAWDWIKSSTGLSELGFLLPLAGVIAGIAALTKFGGDFASFWKRYSYSRELLDKGYSPTQVNNIMKGITQNESLFNMGQTLPIVFIGGLALFAFLNRSKGR